MDNNLLTAILAKLHFKVSYFPGVSPFLGLVSVSVSGSGSGNTVANDGADNLAKVISEIKCTYNYTLVGLPCCPSSCQILYKPQHHGQSF